MKALAFSNNDIALIAWTFGGKLDGCLGFAIYRIDVLAGTETPLPAMATFEGQEATPKRTTIQDPIQKLFWKDVYAKHGGTYKYKIVPMGGAYDNLVPMPYGPLITNQIQLTPNYGALSVYFNRGILATQATAKELHNTPGGGTLVDRLSEHIYKIDDHLRDSLAGDMIDALKLLPGEAKKAGCELKCAFYEFDDPEIIDALKPLGNKLNLILSNMPSKATDAKPASNDTYSEQRADIKAAGAVVTDRFMSSGHIGHNKFQVLLKDDKPVAALFGSTNVTAHGLCAQTNNTIIARSELVAQAYADYWTRLKDDTLPDGTVTGPQAEPLRSEDAQGAKHVDLEDGSGSMDIWFSPNMPKPRSKIHGPDEPCPQDLAQLFDLISKAQTAVLFLVFEPGAPSIVDSIADAQRANPKLFVRGVTTDPNAAGEFLAKLKGEDVPLKKPTKGDPPPAEDDQVIHTRGVTAKDAFAQWSAELNKAGFAVVHDKIVVIDPFTDNCVVATGSHNQGYKASYDNDENLNIIFGHRAVAEAYAAHCLDVYDHYAFRYYLEKEGDKAWHFLDKTDQWQNSYFDGNNAVKSAELSFWLNAIPKGEALPTPHETGSTRKPIDIPRRKAKDGQAPDAA